MPTFHTATTWKTMSRYVVCEKCGCEYTFTVSAAGKGTGRGAMGVDGRQDALDAAEIAANQRIASEPAACPDCGWYQKAMVRELRRRHLRWMHGTGLAFLAAVGLLGVSVLCGPQQRAETTGALPLTLAALFALAGAALVGLRAKWAADYDPNARYPERPPPRPGEPPAARTPEYQRRLDGSASAAWYYRTADGREHGPVSGEALAALYSSGRLRPTDWVWTDGMADWASAKDAFG